MRSTSNLLDARVYCGTWAKYNRGSIAGAWLALSDYSDYDEFMNACRQLHADESDPEFMYQDYEYMPFVRHSEPWLSDIRRWYDMAEDLDGLTDDELNAVCAYWEEIDNGREVSEILGVYCGYYDSEEDYAEQLYTECEMIPDSLINYIDWSRVARDLFFDYHFASGHVFQA